MTKSFTELPNLNNIYDEVAVKAEVSTVKVPEYCLGNSNCLANKLIVKPFWSANAAPVPPSILAKFKKV